MYIYLVCTIPLLCMKAKHIWQHSSQFSCMGYSFVSGWRYTCFDCIDTKQWRLATGFRGYDKLWLIYEIDIWVANLKLAVHFILALRKYFWQCQVTKVFWKYNGDYVMLKACYAADNWCLLSVTSFFNVAPYMLPHLLYNPTHALFTL
jgi:hypothetical protein